MLKNRLNFRIGLRTIKTVIAVIIAMILVESNVSPYSNLTVAMLGAMAAVQPSFKESLESCIAQVVGSVFGSVVGILLLQLPIDHVVSTGIAVVLVITVYNSLHVPYAPSLPCLMVVILCTTPDIEPVTYALGRLWDTVIGLGVGMIINTLIFPYDNRRQIRATVQSLDRDLITFLEDMFDGDDVLPEADEMLQKVDAMEQQLRIFSNQRFLRHMRRQRLELEAFRVCEGKARELVARIALLSRMGQPGQLTDENSRRLRAFGARIPKRKQVEELTERDVVINYHVRQILTLRRELLEALGEEIRISETEK